MRKLVLLLVLMIPLLVVGQGSYNFTASMTTKGHYDPVAGKYNWGMDQLSSIPVVFNMDEKYVLIKGHPYQTLMIKDIFRETITDSYTEYSLDCVDQNGTSVWIYEFVPVTQCLPHLIYLVYPDYVIKYSLTFT